MRFHSRASERERERERECTSVRRLALYGEGRVKKTEREEGGGGRKHKAASSERADMLTGLLRATETNVWKKEEERAEEGRRDGKRRQRELMREGRGKPVEAPSRQ